MKSLSGATQFIPDWLVELAGGEDGKALGKALAALKESGGDLDGYLSRGTPPRKARDKVAKALIEAQQGVVVFIDDVDRLQATELLEVMRFLKSVGDLPKVVYVLSMDRQMVCSLLAEGNIREPDRYLEKIVQSTFDLPIPARWQLAKILVEEIREHFGEVLPKGFQTDRRFNWIALQHVERPRDISRLMNALALNFHALKDAVDPIDFLCVEVIRVLDYEFYQVIRQSKSVLTRRRSRSEDQHAIARMLRKDESPPEERSLRNRRTNVIGLLFPIAEFGATKDVRPPNATEHSLHFRQAVGSEAHFDTYFRFEPAPSVLPAVEMEAILSTEESADLGVKIQGLNQILADGSSPVEHFLKHALGAASRSMSPLPKKTVMAIVGAFNDAIAPEDNVWRLEQRADLCAQLVCRVSVNLDAQDQRLLLYELHDSGSDAVFAKLAAERSRVSSNSDVNSAYRHGFRHTLTELDDLIVQVAANKSHDGTLVEQPLGALLWEGWHHKNPAAAKNWARELAKTNLGGALAILNSVGRPLGALGDEFFGTHWPHRVSELRADPAHAEVASSILAKLK